MKKRKKNDVAALLDYAGRCKGLTFLGGVYAAQHGALPLHLAGGPGPDRRGTGLDPGGECCAVRLAGLRLCGGRHCDLLSGADVYPPGGLPHGVQHPQAGRSPRDEGPAGLF